MRDELSESAKDWYNALDTNHFPDIETVFEVAKLSTKEKEVFLGYREYAELWLLNTRTLDV